MAPVAFSASMLNSPTWDTARYAEAISRTPLGSRRDGPTSRAVSRDESTSSRSHDLPPSSLRSTPAKPPR